MTNELVELAALTVVVVAPAALVVAIALDFAVFAEDTADAHETVAVEFVSGSLITILSNVRYKTQLNRIATSCFKSREKRKRRKILCTRDNCEISPMNIETQVSDITLIRRI